MNVVVFGAAGWLGRAILENFAGRHQVRAFDRGPEAWEACREIDGDWDGEIVHGDIADFRTVEQAMEGMDAVVHTAVYGGGSPDDPQVFLVNLKGLWNVLEVAHQRGFKRVVHIGSAQVKHPKGIFFSADVRRPDGGVYAVCKRLQEEMCRQFYEATGLSIIVLRPCGIVDARRGIGKRGDKLQVRGSVENTGWVCRHDLAEACHLALETRAIEFDVLHTVGVPGAEKHCNVARTREVLGLEYRGDLEQYVVE